MKYLPDFSKLKFEVSANMRKDYIGDWDAEKNKIWLYDKMKTKSMDIALVAVHELVELVVNGARGTPDNEHPEYSQSAHGETNRLAHDLATSVEKLICDVTGFNFAAHQKRCRKLSRGRKK